MLCGESDALSVMTMVAVRGPVLAGAKWPLKTQRVFGIKLAPQVFVKTKEEASAPVTPMLVKFKVSLPIFIKETCWEALDV